MPTVHLYTFFYLEKTIKEKVWSWVYFVSWCAEHLKNLMSETHVEMFVFPEEQDKVGGCGWLVKFYLKLL